MEGNIAGFDPFLNFEDRASHATDGMEADEALALTCFVRDRIEFAPIISERIVLLWGDDENTQERWLAFFSESRELMSDQDYVEGLGEVKRRLST